MKMPALKKNPAPLRPVAVLLANCLRRLNFLPVLPQVLRTAPLPELLRQLCRMLASR